MRCVPSVWDMYSYVFVGLSWLVDERNTTPMIRHSNSPCWLNVFEDPRPPFLPVTWQDFSQSSWGRCGWKKGAKFRGAKFRGSLKLVEPGCIDSCGRFKPWASSWWIKCSRFHLCFKLWSGWGLWSLPKWASENWGNFPTYFHPLTGMFPHKQLFQPLRNGSHRTQSGYATSIVRPIYSPRLEWRTRTIYNLSSCHCWQLI